MTHSSGIHFASWRGANAQLLGADTFLTGGDKQVSVPETPVDCDITLLLDVEEIRQPAAGDLEGELQPEYKPHRKDCVMAPREGRCSPKRLTLDVDQQQKL